MALSAIIRTREKAGKQIIIDILRGSARAELIKLGYDKIKTYGVGRMISYAEWNEYITQLIQLGAIDIAYDEASHLKVTPYGQKILKGEVHVMLARHEKEITEKKSSKKKTGIPANPAERLFSELKALRKDIAAREGIAPYLVFTDKTLLDMVRRRPVTMSDFMLVEGVGERKCVKYWASFTSLIKKFI